MPGEQIQPAASEASDDLEYDLAHEGEQAAQDEAPQPPPAAEPVRVATETPGYDSDYSYDQAHDIPGR